jgi:hypothetical protein
MDKGPHPHTGATYQLFRQPDGSFGVKVSIPDTHPTMVTEFATEVAAEAWVKNHKQQVALGNSLRRRTLSERVFEVSPKKKASPERG